MTTPKRGEVWLVDLGLAAKVRPALVLSVLPGEKERSLITLVPHTTSLRDSAYEVPVKVMFLRPGAFDTQGLVTVPLAHLVRLLGSLSSQQMKAVESSVRAWLGL
jgi:mRNA interferase MazF